MEEDQRRLRCILAKLEQNRDNHKVQNELLIELAIRLARSGSYSLAEVLFGLSTY